MLITYQGFAISPIDVTNGSLALFGVNQLCIHIIHSHCVWLRPGFVTCFVFVLKTLRFSHGHNAVILTITATMSNGHWFLKMR